MSRTLIIVDTPPYGSWGGREALDMVFSLAAFDQEVSLLFLDAGVHWLRKGQAPEDIRQKSAERNLLAAPVFGVEALLADDGACQTYGLSEDRLLDGVTRVTADAALLAGFDHIAFAS
ncbi:DsrE family protein [Marinobacter lutaoensis]|jgi:tRNA 2-thiouridine synthesizing protein C|uniref:Sulfur reduction protein DsrE n=1 Tax=Marinobacter lutaoensis TaxID=135739 RepID=A0A1V2DU14_9GAMM|nr:DsrE family protein [Marinobacter lutaoensis]MBE01823.1 sulfur reduction protein DsrE [Marinobacter sp.]MBI42749.1 sulfur reduction protein DsrE [Oceanospirillales bacterium]NVD35191.1 DsrE family protein [Marinobacter lutaoensis]ONF44173.1 sulfur reduction protein DsrE [Marinobacter lutaoensis]|tara:strand:- start:3167 stop:3520 length:354 start_codon:yes stop_codon:yes gene_type:complete